MSAPGGVAAPAAAVLDYVATLGGWAAWHLAWQAAAAAVVYRLWVPAARGASPAARYRVAVLGLAALPAAALAAAVATHGVLLADARRAAADALAGPATGGAPAAVVGAGRGLASGLATAYAALYDGAAPWLAAGALLWAAGAAVALARLALERRRMGALLRATRPAPRATRRRVAALARAAGLRRPPRVVVGPAAAGAFVAGRSAPVLVLPAGLARPGLTGSASRAPDRLAWDALVLHELAHVRRGDYVAQWGVRAAEALCWWHPGARRLARAAADAREECCDEEAVRAAARATARPPRQARVALARALVWLADAASGAAPPGARRGAPAPLGMAATSGALSARVRLLLRADAPPARGGGRAHLARRLLAALLAGAGGAVVAAGPTLAAPAAARGQRLPLAAARSGTVPVRRVAIDAGDPAGRFTVRLLNGRVAEVTVDGRRVGPRQVTVRGTGLRVRGAGDVVLLDARLDPRGALSWTARPARAR